MKLKTLFSPVAALTIAFGGGIAAPVRAGSDAYNVGYAGGLLHGFTCKSRNGEITQSQARSEMRRLLKAEGVPVSYASRSDVMETAKTLFLIKGC